MSDRARQAAGAAVRDDHADVARAAKVRRNAWLLAGLAVFFYLGFIAWTFLRGTILG